MEFNYFHKNFVIKGLRDSKRDYELEVKNFALYTFEDLNKQQLILLNDESICSYS